MFNYMAIGNDATNQAMNVYVHKDGKNYGPYPVEQLIDLVEEGNLSLEDLACHDGQNWVTVAQVPGFVAASEREPIQPQPLPSVEEVENPPENLAPKTEEKAEPPAIDDNLGILSKSNVAPENVEVENRPSDESLASEFVPQSISGNPSKRVSEQTNLQFDKREICPEPTSQKKSRRRTALIACTCIMLFVVGTSFAIWGYLQEPRKREKNTPVKNENTTTSNQITIRTNEGESLGSEQQTQSSSSIQTHQKVLKEPQDQKAKFIRPINPNLIKPLIDPVI